MTGALLLLEAAGPEAGHLAAAAAAAGLAVHAVTQPADYTTYPAVLRHRLAGHLLTDFSRPAQAVTDITAYGRHIGAVAALTSNEYLTVILAQVCAALRLPGNDPTRITAARNKLVMHQTLAAAGVTTPATQPVSDLAGLHDAAGALRPPWVIKPADGAGSAGITVVREHADLVPGWHTARAARSPYRPGPVGDVLLQQHVPGVEYSVESIAHAGTITHLCLTAKAVTGARHRVETGHRLPADLPAPLTATVLAQVSRAMHATGIRAGAAHTEIIVNPGTGACTVLEVAARLGAGHIGTLIGHALGIDVPAALIDIARSHRPRLTPTRHRYAAVRFVTSPADGRLQAVHDLPTVGPDLPEANLRAAPGATVRIPTANRDRIGYFIVTGDHGADVDDHAQRLLDQVRVTIDPHPVTATAAAR